MKRRKLTEHILTAASKKQGRILIFTGARQTGKTTLARALFPSYAYLSIEDPVLRTEYSRLTAHQWKDLYPLAILDEVQKAPLLIESIKSVYDQWSDPRYILLGSSQILLLEKVRESLAGRCTIIELYPLTLPELETDSWDSDISNSIYQNYIVNPNELPLFLPSFSLHPKFTLIQKAWQHYINFGGYPALTDDELTNEDRYSWLSQYVKTYLERDVRDLASLRDLEPFIVLQHYIAFNTAAQLNIANIAKQVGVSAKTVQRYIRYLELSYQVLVLPSWSRNNNKRLVKAPKIHMLDNGVLQAILQKRGGLTGAEFESLVLAELYKQTKTLALDARFYYLRTFDGREVDLLIELPAGYIAFEIKIAKKISHSDARHLLGLEMFLDKPLMHSFILSQDPETKTIAPGITAVHAAYFLG